MATEATPKLITAEEFMTMDLGEGLQELVRGEIVDVPPPGLRHGRICLKVGMILESYGSETGHGFAVSNDVAVLTKKRPDTVRGADVLYFSYARLPDANHVLGIPPVAPDLVVEVYSPSNRPGEMKAKVAEYLGAGVAMVWVLYPEHRQITIERAEDPIPIVLGDGDTLEDLPELPGFRCAVADFFD